MLSPFVRIPQQGKQIKMSQHEDELDLQLIADFTDSELTPMQALWARVNAQAAELDPKAARYDNEIRKLNPKHQNGFMAASTKVIWVTSLKNPAKGIRAGRVFTCPPLLAAQLLVGGTHKVASDEEIKTWHNEQGMRKETTRAIDAAKNPQPMQQVVIGQEVIQAIRESAPKANAGAKQ
jgi:hypothetical protein